ncbi:NAD(P)H-dependent oxidoreductase [Tenacibaculum sp. Bg11-29]|uniref:NADPH-dependent FMN reductase n=1 Tax=Tenacibaculum sp. Bg11-29 TaxID=2058306 RepID=UPI000C34CF1A|nr:NADPH-dependent FMN reductase [Tenacibaculum sp. Bg11-29]PKH49474.1 NAD(P)H-dependent oxidoreductase [Tenacibaculum sp. Bg11-29]
MHKKITIIIGSLRRGSYARKIALNVLDMFPEDFEVKIIEIRNLPLYNFDYDDPLETDFPIPKEYTEFRNTIKSSDGILFVTPENNRTIPACLKNVVDICSKPNHDVAWKNKPNAIISHSVGKMGGYSSQKNLRLALSYFDMPTVQQPEVFLGNSPTYFDKNGTLSAVRTKKFLQDYINRFSQLVKK